MENGENLFKIIPNFSKDKLNNFPFKYGIFEEREEIIFEDKMFYSEDGFTKIGKLLVPFFEVIDRASLEKWVQNSRTHSFDREKYVRVLDEYSATKEFYNNSGEIVPLDIEQFLVLNEKQLE